VDLRGRRTFGGVHRLVRRLFIFSLVAFVFCVAAGGLHASAAPAFSLQVSSSPDRSSPQALDGKQVSGDIFVFVPNASGITEVRFYVDDPQRTGTPYHTEGASPWDLVGTNSDGSARAYSTLKLSNGNHVITAAIDDATGTSVTSATMNVSNGTASCTPVPCSQVRVRLPYTLDWSTDHGGVKDKNGVGTGFTWIDRPTNGTGYIPNNLQVTGGQLQVTTTRGIQAFDTNSQDNALAVGIDAPSQVTDIRTTMVNPPSGTGNYEQAGLWFGNDEANYVKLVLLSSPNGLKLNFFHEEADTELDSLFSSAINLAGQSLKLALIADPTNRTIEARYSIGSGPETTIGSVTVSGELFSFDAAGINPEIGTRSFGGIIASHRNGASPLTYSFDDFSVTKQAQAPSGGALPFKRTSIPVPVPTSMAWGPDGRLYVTEMFGKIHALSFGADGQVTGDEMITAIGSRLTLGITVDPLSTASDVILWVSHSNPSTSNGQPNSGIVSRLSGAGFATRQDVITGLPRAIANHATNSLHFGPDGKLYIAQGGNTGAGAPNNANTEFGTMAEQPLSAAILRADVRSPSFDGSCNNTSDIFGPPPCDVETYATGLRNTYDFVFHSNGQIYGPNNGLGVDGSFPPSPTPPCTGFGSTTSWTQGGNDPGPQPDPLNRIVQGKYYGHPNPSRNECVFGDGHYQNVPPLPNFMPPMYNLGDNRSADGVAEYTGDGFCGDLRNELLIANYSVGDDLTRVRLSADGLSVANATSLVGDLSDPLPVTVSPSGRIFVGELGNNDIVALDPIDTGCWQSKHSLPEPLLDAGGAAVNGKLYVVAGKTSTSHRNTVLRYNPVADRWAPATTVPPLPGSAVENPAAVALLGKLYVFGGSTGPFSGAVNNAAVYNPATNAWTALPSMGTARGGATAKAIGKKIYVAGGMDPTGASLASAEVFDTTTNTWSNVASMGTRRDNPGSAVFNGKLYVFGGRTRNADGTSPVPILASTEMYTPGNNKWTARAPMPTARRTMVVGTLKGRAQVMGGEIQPNGDAFPQNEEYDPVANSWRELRPMLTPRHGAAAGTINGAVYVAGGGPQGGFTLTDAVEKFAFQNP
jgi:glucose/arabinose dehydrogenase/N-acetylneuraminic acid mutarotase